MELVAFVWLTQIAVGMMILLADADGGQSDLAARVLRALKSRLVVALAIGCLCFLLIAYLKSNGRDHVGGDLAAASLKIQLGALVLFFVVKLFTRLAETSKALDLVFGSARFALWDEASRAGHIGESGIRLGRWRGQPTGPSPAASTTVCYTGEKHLLTVAPTRAGKGVSTIIPNLLTFADSAIIIDPKGENAGTTYERRAQIGRAFALDPWGITDKDAATFNPLDILTPDSPTLIEDALLIADALIIPEHGGNATFFSEQARSFITGFLLHIATDSSEAHQRHLGRLRDILSAGPEEFADVGMAMAQSTHPAVVAAATRIVAQNDEVCASIISTAQQNTHFLDSPALRASLATSSFQFADLKGETPASLYIVLPVDRLGTYSRWLRLLIALGIAQLARTPTLPGRRVLFMLDEFAQLGRLQMVEEAYGLMAGMGIQLHAIVQDLSQLNRLYPDGWQTFLANAGAIQVFGTRDWFTAEYFSKMLGQTTASVESYAYSTGHSSSFAPGGQGGSTSGTSSNSSWSRAPTARPLLFPDELMRMERQAQLLFIENAHPILADKIVWHEDEAFRQLAGNHDNQPPMPPARPTVALAEAPSEPRPANPASPMKPAYTRPSGRSQIIRDTVAERSGFERISAPVVFLADGLWLALVSVRARFSNDRSVLIDWQVRSENRREWPGLTHTERLTAIVRQARQSRP